MINGDRWGCLDWDLLEVLGHPGKGPWPPRTKKCNLQLFLEAFLVKDFSGGLWEVLGGFESPWVNGKRQTVNGKL